MCMSGGSSPAPRPQETPPPQVSLPPAQQQMAAPAPASVTLGADPDRPKAGQRRARENARYADKTSPNMRRGDAGGITM